MSYFAYRPDIQALHHQKVADGRRSLVLDVFVGGVIFAEISALRYLSAKEGMAYDLIVGTTKMVNGHSKSRHSWKPLVKQDDLFFFIFCASTRTERKRVIHKYSMVQFAVILHFFFPISL
ncbi:hypothetical protein MKX01_008049 [Papaver californicum]|nr:hypothetical protein MKX01_008049 [Papaver californicum]